MSETGRELPASLRKLPEHAAFTERLIRSVESDGRFRALLLAGSGAEDAMDVHSDLDFVVAVAPEHYQAVMAERQEFAERLGGLLSAFVGEHVGEPRLLICLYGPPLLHVDLKFVMPTELADRVDEPRVLWEMDRAASEVLSASRAEYPQPDAQWIEDRFWTLVHYAASRAVRGEVLEAASALSFITARFLGPLILLRAGAQPNGVRRIEDAAPGWMPRLGDLLPDATAASCLEALERAVEIYRDLRSDASGIVVGAEAEKAVTEYLANARDEVGEPPEAGKGWAGKHSERLHRRRGRRP